MTVWRFFLLSLFVGAQFFTAPAFAAKNLSGFLTPRDLMYDDTDSNLILHNNSNSSTTVYGLYVRQFAYVTPGAITCNDATVMYPTNDTSTENQTAGAVVMQVVIPEGGSAVIGANYLYNMIYQASYYKNNLLPHSPPGCALPGCTWGDDTAVYNWCIYLGALTPVVTSEGYTANVPPSAVSASAVGYDYNLIGASHYQYLGPITCDDQTLTCSVATPQTQSFP